MTSATQQTITVDPLRQIVVPIRLWQVETLDDARQWYAQAVHELYIPTTRLIWVAHPRAINELYCWISALDASTMFSLMQGAPKLFGLPILEGREPGLWLTLESEELWEKP